jgi:hypothetical protein
MAEVILTECEFTFYTSRPVTAVIPWDQYSTPRIYSMNSFESEQHPMTDIIMHRNIGGSLIECEWKGDANEM